MKGRQIPFLVLVLLILCPTVGQGGGLLGETAYSYGASFAEFRHSIREVDHWGSTSNDFSDISSRSKAVFAQLNLPLNRRLDFNFEISIQGANSQTGWSPALSLVAYASRGDLKPFAAVTGGGIGSLKHITAEPIGFFGLTAGVEFTLGESSFATVAANIFRVDGTEQSGLEVELGHWLGKKTAGVLGFQYTDNGPDTFWHRNPHSLGVMAAISLLAGKGDGAEQWRPWEPIPEDECPR